MLGPGKVRTQAFAILGTAAMNLLRREKRTIIILGCEHRVQLAETESSPAFRQLVESIVEQHGVQLVGEEAEQGKRSIAQEIAETRNVTYLNVDIRDAVQCQIRRPPHMKFNRKTRLVEVVVDSDKYALAWNLVREHHMYKTFVDALPGSEPALLICGRSHVSGFVELLGDKYKITTMSFDTNLNAGCATRLMSANPGMDKISPSLK